jgi:hypothetical protein
LCLDQGDGLLAVACAADDANVTGLEVAGDALEHGGMVVRDDAGGLPVHHLFSSAGSAQT